MIIEVVKRCAACFRRADALLLVLLLAFAVRFALSWNEGYGFDISLYQGWARSAVEYGVVESYGQQVGGNMLPDYPPVTLTILAGFGHIYKTLFGEFDPSSVRYRMFIKLPAIFTDVLICWLLYMAVRRWKSGREGVIAALLYAVNPGSIYDSAIWGQTDSIYTLFLLAAMIALVTRHRYVSAVFLAFSILTKLQAIVLFPFFAFLLLGNLRDMLRYAIVGILTVIIVLLPFALGGVLEHIYNVYFGAVGRYDRITFGAYNFWWALLGDKGWSTESTVSLFGFSTYAQWGLALFGLMYAYILWIFRHALCRKNMWEPLFFCAALLCTAFFLFLPQMHERYFFPFLVFGTPLCFIEKKTAVAFWIMVGAFTVNLMGVMPLSPIDKALFREFDALDVFVASTIVWLCVFLLVAAHHRYAPKASLH